MMVLPRPGPTRDPEQPDRATLNSFDASPVGIREFAHADGTAALEWAAAAQCGGVRVPHRF